MQWVDDKIISEVTSGKPDLVVLCDFGSGYLDLIAERIPEIKIVILDHHQIIGKTTNPNIVQLNPHNFGIDGATEVSGSGVTYF
jgi:RecJ-like exonuclease